MEKICANCMKPIKMDRVWWVHKDTRAMRCRPRKGDEKKPPQAVPFEAKGEG